MGDFDKAVSDGMKASAVAGSIAGTAAAIGAAAGASLGPFAAIAAPIGAAVGALVGFFVSLAKKPSKEELARAAAAAHAAQVETSNKAWALAFAAETLTTSVSLSLAGGGRTGDPAKDVEHDITRKGGVADSLRNVEEKNPAYRPLIEALFNGLRVAAKEPDARTRGLAIKQMKTLVEIFKAFASTPGDINADPFAYLRPPLSEMFGPALKAAGIDIADPRVLEALRGNYHVIVSEPKPLDQRVGGVPIVRKSVPIKYMGGTKTRVDMRAFDPNVAPYGVGSFKVFPNAAWASGAEYKGSDTAGLPLLAPWPYGLDSDNFAKPPPGQGLSRAAKAGLVGGGAAILALLFFL